MTPLFYAAQSGDEAMVAALVNAGADVDKEIYPKS
jgi:ankyrin repeat protein